LNNLLERTPNNNLKFSDKIALELENEGKVREVDVKENLLHTSPSRAERLRQATKHHSTLREVSVDRDISSPKKNEPMSSTAFIEKKPIKKLDKTWKLEPIQPRNAFKNGQNHNHSFDHGNMPLNKRKFSHDIEGYGGRKILNVRHIALKEGKSFNVDYPEPLPAQEILNDKDRNSKKNFHLFRQALSKTLFKRRRDSTQASNIVQRLFYNSILTKGLSEA